MIIQHNIPALNAYRQMTMNTKALAANLEKLSSGFRINRAGDDAAGLAISEKMRAQIKGLETAQKNALDGISLIQTAEGALTEVHAMLNRMVELATQSANGIYDDSIDRAALDREFQQLKTEIDRISQATNFNGKNLLDGSLALSTGTAQGVGSAKSIQIISEAVAAAKATNTFEGMADLINGATGVAGDVLRPAYDVFAGDSFTLDLDLTDILAANSAPGTGGNNPLSGVNSLWLGDWKIDFANAGTASDGTTPLVGIQITATNLVGGVSLSGEFTDINQVLDHMTAHDDNWSFMLNSNNQIVLTADVNGTSVNNMADVVNGAGTAPGSQLSVTGTELLALNGNAHNVTNDGTNTSIANKVSIIDERPVTALGERFEFNGISAGGTTGGTGGAPNFGTGGQTLNVNGYTLTFEGNFTIAGSAGTITLEGGSLDAPVTFQQDTNDFADVFAEALAAMSEADGNWRYSYDATSATGTLTMTAMAAGLGAPGRVTVEGLAWNGTPTTGTGTDPVSYRAVSTGTATIPAFDDGDTLTLNNITYEFQTTPSVDPADREFSDMDELLALLNADYEDEYIFSINSDGALVATAVEDGEGMVNLRDIKVTYANPTADDLPGLLNNFVDGALEKDAVIREVPLGTGANKISTDLSRYLEFGQSTPVAAVRAVYELAATSEVDFLTRLGVADVTNASEGEILSALGLSAKDYDVFLDFNLSSNTGTRFAVGDASNGVYVVAKRGGVDENREKLFQLDNSSIWETRSGADTYRELTMIVSEEVSDGNLINKTFTLNGITYEFKGQNDIDENDQKLDDKVTARLANGNWAVNLSALRFNNEGDGPFVDGLEAREQVAKAIMEAVNMAEAIRNDPAATDPVENFAVIGRGINVDPNLKREDQKHIVTFNMAIGAGGVGGAAGAGGGLNLQIGDTSDAYNILSVSVEDMSTKGLGIHNLNVATYEAATAAIGTIAQQGDPGTIKGAINLVSTQRAVLGSLQNRLDYSINNLGVTTENIIAAESRIRDTDMAQEMMFFTKNNILLQAAQAMLAQANMLPQGVLSLLR